MGNADEYIKEETDDGEAKITIKRMLKEDGADGTLTDPGGKVIFDSSKVDEHAGKVEPHR